MSQTLLPFDLERPQALSAALHELSKADSKERGAIHTRREVVEFILDLVGYTPEANLAQARLLEPACGSGDFVVAAAERLITSYLLHGGRAAEVAGALKDAIRAVDLHSLSLQEAIDHTLQVLTGQGIPQDEARELTASWYLQDDFLLADLAGGFTHVVGNPPYVRQELIPAPLLEEYRRRFQTIYDRADLYIPFIEKGLTLLAPGGALGFICSDRWMKNRYGGPLRRMIARHFHLRYYVDMVDTPAFKREVTAYPGIFVIAREPARATRVARRPEIEPESLQHLAQVMTGPDVKEAASVEEVRSATNGSDDPWLLDAAGEVALLRRLEAAFPSIEETGSSVGIGVATGADGIYVRHGSALPVEESRKLPIITAPEIRSGRIASTGKYVLNPFEPDGSLAAFERYPRFAAYIKANEPRIKRRNVAKKNPGNWYRTIDRIYPGLLERPKLLIPDIKGSVHVVLDEGAYYPHHNLYYVTSEAWDIRALQAVLRSAIAEYFVAMYSVKMRGGYLRYQAQYLRRIRLPRWETVDDALRRRLIEAAHGEDRTPCDEAAFELYGLGERDPAIISAVIYDVSATR